VPKTSEAGSETSADEELQGSSTATPTTRTTLFAVRQSWQSWHGAYFLTAGADSVGEPAAVARSGAVCTRGCTTACRNSKSASQALILFTHSSIGKFR